MGLVPPSLPLGLHCGRRECVAGGPEDRGCPADGRGGGPDDCVRLLDDHVHPSDGCAEKIGGHARPSDRWATELQDRSQLGGCPRTRGGSPFTTDGRPGDTRCNAPAPDGCPRATAVSTVLPQWSPSRARAERGPLPPSLPPPLPSAGRPGESGRAPSRPAVCKCCRSGARAPARAERGPLFLCPFQLRTLLSGFWPSRKTAVTSRSRAAASSLSIASREPPARSTLRW